MAAGDLSARQARRLADWRALPEELQQSKLRLFLQSDSSNDCALDVI
jgi:hypothetical protein